MTEFKLPSIGEGINKVTITDILVTNNQQIKNNDVIIIVESEKASMEIPIDKNCIVKNILVKVGDTISPGESIIQINYTNEDKTNIKENLTKTYSDDKREITKSIDSSKNNLKNKDNQSSKNNDIYASPSVRKIARELECDLSKIVGSGKNGRITSEDIYNTVQGKKNTSNNIYEEASKWGLTEKIELNNIKLTTGKRLHDSWVSIPHVTQFDECDVTELDKIRTILINKNTNSQIKVSFIPFFIKIIVKIFKELTIFNSSLSDDNKFLIQKSYFNIGVAVETKRGLVVPVIKNVDKKSIKTISKELTTLIKKAKNKKLTLEDMSGGCFTISSLGGISGKFFTPIINPPEVAILGISNISIKPIFIKNKFKARKILPISLSYNHRVIDGADAARFTKLFSKYIENPNLLISE